MSVEMKGPQVKASLQPLKQLVDMENHQGILPSKLLLTRTDGSLLPLGLSFRLSEHRPGKGQ